MPILAVRRLGLAYFILGPRVEAQLYLLKTAPTGRNFKEERLMKRTQHPWVPAPGTGPRQFSGEEVQAR